MSGTEEKRLRRRLQQRPNGCLEWTGAVQNSGYGYMKSSDKPYRHKLVHRVAYEVHFGRIPDDREVRHLCHNKRCCNPEHLVLGTRADNMRDMVKADRQKRSSINFDEVREMRRRGLTQREIALHFGVSRPLISLILAGKIARSATT